LALTFAVSLAANDDSACKNDFKSFLKCVKDKYEARSQSEKDAAKKEKQDKANQCFADAGCDAPDWGASPLGGKHGGKGGPGGMGDMPPKVKDCIKKKLVEKIGGKLNECLDKKHIQRVNFTELAEDAEGAGLSMEEGSSGKDGLQASMGAKFNAVKAVDKCATKKGSTDAVKPLEQCLQKIKHDQKPKVCAFVKSCEDQVSGPCKKRGQEIRKGLCECKKEKEVVVAKKLKDLGQSNKKVGLQDLMKTISEDIDVQDMMNQVELCYTETGEPEPPLLKAAMAIMGRGGNGGGAGAALSAKMSISGQQVYLMGDMMELDANDKSECDNCP